MKSERVLPPGARTVPESAKCVFEGEIYNVYQWPQKLPSGEEATFEMLKRPDTVMVIALNKGGGVVVCDERQPGGLVRRNHLPTGRVDPSDCSTLSAAQRELREETGSVFADWQLLDVVQMEKKIEWFTYLFVAKNCLFRGIQSLDDGEEIVTKTVPLGEVLHKENVLRYFPWLHDVESAEDLEPRDWLRKNLN